MKFIVFLTAAFATVAQARHLQNSDYCDEWSKCPEGKKCWNKKCVSDTCADSSNCSEGFECSQGKCYPLTQAPNDGRYCDQWTACSDTEQCINKKCAPLFCSRDTNCVVGFVCYNGKCLFPEQHGEIQGYCDAYTPCKSTHQCVDKKCVPFTCANSLDCISNYTCNEGYCIQVNPNHTRGRYCDAENECDILHKCVDSQCFWK